jgi:hypothetical protein
VHGSRVGGDLLRVEHPHVVAFAQALGGVEDVAFVGGDDDRTGTSAMTGTASEVA